MSDKKIIPPGMKLGGMDLSKLGAKPDRKTILDFKWVEENIGQLYKNDTEVFTRTKDLLKFLNVLNEQIVALLRIFKIDPAAFMQEVYNKKANEEFMELIEKAEEPLLAAQLKEATEKAGKELEDKAEPLGEPAPETAEELKKFQMSPDFKEGEAPAAEEPNTEGPK